MRRLNVNLDNEKVLYLDQIDLNKHLVTVNQASTVYTLQKKESEKSGFILLDSATGHYLQPEGTDIFLDYSSRHSIRAATNFMHWNGVDKRLGVYLQLCDLRGMSIQLLDITSTPRVFRKLRLTFKCDLIELKDIDFTDSIVVIDFSGGARYLAGKLPENNPKENKYNYYITCITRKNDMDLFCKKKELLISMSNLFRFAQLSGQKVEIFKYY